MLHGYFDNSLKLTRAILKRDRITILIWLVILVASSVILAPGVDAMFPDVEARLIFILEIILPYVLKKPIFA